MPIYEYQCTACGHKLDAFQKISDDLLRDCPECNRSALKKCVTAAAFKLKGGGWYETDFKDKKKPAEKKPDATDAKSDNKADTPDKKEASPKQETAAKSYTKANSSD